MAAHVRAAGADAALGGIKVSKQLAALLDKLLAQIGEREAAGGAMHEAHAEAALQRVEPAAHDHGGDALDQRGGGEAAFFGGEREASDFGVAVHSIPHVSTAVTLAGIPSCSIRRYS